MTIALPDSPQLQMIGELEEQQPRFLRTTNQASLERNTEAGMFPWEQLQGDLRCTLYCLQKVVVITV